MEDQLISIESEHPNVEFQETQKSAFRNEYKNQRKEDYSSISQQHNSNYLTAEPSFPNRKVGIIDDNLNPNSHRGDNLDSVTHSKSKQKLLLLAATSPPIAF
jgi:hypothetical protein